MPLIAPPLWSQQQFDIEAEVSRNNFRNERLDETLAQWSNLFDHYVARVTRLLDVFGMINPTALTAETLVEILEAGLEDELRYFAGPPISADDLEELANASLAPKNLKSNPEEAHRVIGTILDSMDPKRFPWVDPPRQPTDSERYAAIFASASMLTRQRVQTSRANESKEMQEAAVKEFLRGLGFIEVPTRTMNTLAEAPDRGHFCSEAMVGSRKADVPVRLFDGRLLPIECKVSNSSTNSVKRLNNDAGVKAKTWKTEFGINQIVPAAVLSGVFKTLNLIQAQEGGLTIFWAHKLDDLGIFINQAR